MMDAEQIAAHFATSTEELPATYHSGSDRYASAVVGSTATGKTIQVRSGSSGRVETYSLRSDGRYRRRGAVALRRFYVTVGTAEDHRDPHF